MVMTLVRGPVVDLFWTRGKIINGPTTSGTTLHNSIKGTLMITVGSFSWAFFVILQVSDSRHCSKYNLLSDLPDHVLGFHCHRQSH
uniref:WAT1-related protein n=1 Tax=Rhizophora mucronata TaxID=61149 RepID=A0A2P2NZI2_RHIMU